jgi:hypothetical protein
MSQPGPPGPGVPTTSTLRSMPPRTSRSGRPQSYASLTSKPPRTPAIRAWHQRGSVTERDARVLARSPARRILGQEIVGRGALADRIRPLQHRRLLAVTPRRSTKDGPVGCDRRPPATASGAEVGQMTWSQLALNGCDDARRSTRNPRKIGVSASSVAVQHCCGPGCHNVDVHLPGASQTPTPARSLLGLAISHRSQDLVRGSLLPGYAANGDRSAASTAPVPPEVDLGCCPCPGGPVHRTAPPCCPAVTARLSSRPAPPAWCADTSPGPAVIWEAGHGAGRGSVA